MKKKNFKLFQSFHVSVIGTSFGRIVSSGVSAPQEKARDAPHS